MRHLYIQSAYRAGHSTETAVVRVQNDILEAIDSGKCVFLVLLDLSANLNLTCTLLQSMKIIMQRRGLLVRGSVHHVIERVGSGKMKSKR